MPGIRVLDHVVAVAVPAIPIVAIRSRGDLVLRRLGVASNGRHFSRMNFGAALWSGNLRFARAHDHQRIAIGAHFYAENTVVMCGMDGYVRCIDFGLGFAVFRNAEISKALGQLKLNCSLG